MRMYEFVRVCVPLCIRLSCTHACVWDCFRERSVFLYCLVAAVFLLHTFALHAVPWHCIIFMTHHCACNPCNCCLTQFGCTFFMHILAYINRKCLLKEWVGNVKKKILISSTMYSFMQKRGLHTMQSFDRENTFCFYLPLDVLLYVRALEFVCVKKMLALSSMLHFEYAFNQPLNYWGLMNSIMILCFLL